MLRTVSATEARVHFGDLMRAVVDRGETIVVERSGSPQVVVLSVREYDRLREGREQPEEWELLLDRVHALIRQHHGDQPMPDAAEVINAGREERDAELLAGLL
jgi:prevent-host-death family protein